MALKGGKHSEEHKRKISESRKASDKVFRYPREMRTCAAPGCEIIFESPTGGIRKEGFVVGATIE